MISQPCTSFPGPTRSTSELATTGAGAAKQTAVPRIRQGTEADTTVTSLDGDVLVVGHVEIARGLGQYAAAGRCIQDLAFEGRGKKREE